MDLFGGSCSYSFNPDVKLADFCRIGCNETFGFGGKLRENHEKNGFYI